jgi:hypothetical protein
MNTFAKISVGIIVCGFASCVGLAAIAASQSQPQAPKPEQMQMVATPQQAELAVSNLKFHPGQFGGSITGEVKNTSYANYSYIQVEIALLDKEGALIGSTLANANNLSPGQTWKFDAPALVTGKRIAKVEVKNIEAF